MADGAAAHIGDDLHIRMRVRVKTGMWLDYVIIDHQQFAKAHFRGIPITGKAEMMPGVQPPMVGTAKRVIFVVGDHLPCSCVGDLRMSQHEPSYMVSK